MPATLHFLDGNLQNFLNSSTEHMSLNDIFPWYSARGSPLRGPAA